uniref:ARA2_2 protein n=1 Tax=Fopius arisanus TaxID=64838 RepID=A0A0C9QYR5_9HYME
MSNLPATYVEGFHDLEAVRAMEYTSLGKTGLKVSKLSLGGGTFGGNYGPFDEAEAIATIREALRLGINYIDTGPWYGQGLSERIIGKALKGVPRAAYYLATKVGRYELDFENMFDFSIEKSRRSFQESLERLQLDYVDVLQVHDIEFAPSLDIIITQTLPEISRQVSQGRARFIGITGYPVSTLKECIEKSNINISMILSYARHTLIDDTLLQYVPFFHEHNIGIINASAPCMGLLTTRGPPDWHPASDETKKQCHEAAQYCTDHDSGLERLAVWHALQSPDIATHLIGMQNLEQLRTNLDVVYNGITDKERTLLNEVLESSRNRRLIKCFF